MAQATPIKGDITISLDQEAKRMIRALVTSVERLAQIEADRRRDERQEQVAQSAPRQVKENLTASEEAIYVVGDTVYTNDKHEYLMWEHQIYSPRCGATVLDSESVCVLPEGHEGDFHVDWDGIGSKK